MKRKPVKPLLRTVHRTVNALHLKSYEVYQPVLTETGLSRGTRECDVRWKAISGVLAARECRSFVDLGCCEGYYVIQAAQAGVPFCLGIDFDQRRVFTCTNQLVLHDLQGVGFMMASVAHELVEAMPVFESVNFLSVLHHMMYQHGVDYCRSLMKLVRERTSKVCFFEMGQSDEFKESWAKDMPDMGADPHQWIHDFLLEAGFASADKISTAPSYAGEVQRALFAAYV